MRSAFSFSVLPFSTAALLFGVQQFGVTRVTNESDGVRILRIHNVQPHHCGEVQLSVTHCGKSSSTLRAYTSLVVLPGRAALQGDSTQSTSDVHKKIEALNVSEQLEVPACILEGPQDCTALIGGSVKLSVCYEAVPRAQVCWYKGVSVIRILKSVLKCIYLLLAFLPTNYCRRLIFSFSSHMLPNGAGFAIKVFRSARLVVGHTTDVDAPLKVT